MEPEQSPEIVTESEKPSALQTLHTVTPLSKYFAMVLFITLPFIGGWIGYKYAPEKIVEVEKVIVKEAESGLEDRVSYGRNQDLPSTNDWLIYANEDMGIGFKYPHYLKIDDVAENQINLKYIKELCSSQTSGYYIDEERCLSATPIIFLKKQDTNFLNYSENLHSYVFREPISDFGLIDGREARRGDVGDMVTQTVIMVDYPLENTVLEIIKNQTHIYHVTNDNEITIQQDFIEMISTLDFTDSEDGADSVDNSTPNEVEQISGEPIFIPKVGDKHGPFTVSEVQFVENIEDWGLRYSIVYTGEVTLLEGTIYPDSGLMGSVYKGTFVPNSESMSKVPLYEEKYKNDTFFIRISSNATTLDSNSISQFEAGDEVVIFVDKVHLINDAKEVGDSLHIVDIQKK